MTDPSPASTAASTSASTPTFTGAFWHVVTAVLLIALATSGCKNNSASGPAPGPQPAPQPVPSMSELDRTPPPVREAFRKDMDREDAKVVSVKGRLMPDGLVHYTITSTGKKGERFVDVYRADGIKMPAK